MKESPAAPAHWGARQVQKDTWRLALWAPQSTDVTVTIGTQTYQAIAADQGWFVAECRGESGDAYTLSLDGQTVLDPAARWLDSIAGPARLCEPSKSDQASPELVWEDAVILEIHIGTFTEAGTFAAAAGKMQEIAALGITAIEIMPVNAFPGARGWGYDGAFIFAPHPAYGTPADLIALVDAIHAAGMMALLDVVYNHFGLAHVSLYTVAPAFFDPNRNTPWGAGINYTQAAVRDFFIQNALMWVRDYGFDGLRVDAVHQIKDPTSPHLLTELADTVRAAVPERAVHLIAEDERNLPDFRDAGTFTAEWNDDYHHAVHCLLTGEDESYYATYAVDPMADLVRALSDGHVDHGQPRPPTGERRGAPSAHLPPSAFVNANQTHDQIGNRAQGDRMLALVGPDAMRIAHAILLCAPAIPMLFMGEESGSRAPFQFFVDFDGPLGEAVRKGRAAEFAGFAQFGGPVADPLSGDTFRASRPYAVDAPDAADWRDLTRRCLTLRADKIVPLLRSGQPKADVIATGKKSFYGQWDFPAGRLELIAHLGTLPDQPVRLHTVDVALNDATDPFHFAMTVSLT